MALPGSPTLVWLPLHKQAPAELVSYQALLLTVQGFLAGLTLGLLPLPTPAELEDVPMPVLPALVDLHGTPFEAPADFLQVGKHNLPPSRSCLTACWR